MQVITVELLNDKALKLLQQLESLNVLRLVVPKKKAPTIRRKWAGSISKQTAQKMLSFTEQSRQAIFSIT